MAEYDEKNMWIDPLEEEGGSGVLLSDQIGYYVKAVKLIDPFHHTYLRPASYDLTVGDEYFVNDYRRPLREGEKIEIPPNGLAYVKTRESFNIPYYLMARYSLRVQQVYRGLMLDNGLQVDPGYSGPITVPIHNLTDDARRLEYGETFLSVDFTRTTRFRPSIIDEIRSERDLVARRGELTGIKGEDLVLFWKNLQSFKKPKGVFDLWLPGETHKSSLEVMRNDLDRVAGTVRKLEVAWGRFKNVGYLAGIGIALTLVGLMLGNFYWSSGKYSDMQEKLGQARSELRVLQDHDSRARELTKEVEELSAKVKSLEAEPKRPAKKEAAP